MTATTCFATSAVSAGLGKLKALPDELLIQVLSLLSAESLGRLTCVNRALYCFSSHEELWRALTLEVSQSLLSFCARRQAEHCKEGAAPTCDSTCSSGPVTPAATVLISNHCA